MQLDGEGGGQQLHERWDTAHHDPIRLQQGFCHVHIQHPVQQDAYKGLAGCGGEINRCCVWEVLCLVGSGVGGQGQRSFP